MAYNSAELLENGKLPQDIQEPLKTYISEAQFFAKVVAPDLSRLSPGSQIIEIGSGIGLLALFLSSKGFAVTAFEPQSSGFNQMNEMRREIVANWKPVTPSVEFREALLDESTKLNKLADYIFAINVIEHVPNFVGLIANGIRAKTDDGIFRLVCPNYTIPYEPHFNIPIIFSKKITKFIFRKKIGSSSIPNSEEFWNDLSWPTQRGLKKSLKSVGWEVTFSRDATNEYLKRALSDSAFIDRKGKIVGRLFKLISLLAKIVRFVTPVFIPIIDCRISTKKKKN